MKHLSTRISLGLIFALGLALRLFQIGTDGFWVDELGVAQAAFVDTPWQAINVARSHVMAMPMDYITTWAMGQVSIDEGWLRLPAAMWGVLTLPATFFLYRQIINRRAAIWGIFFLTLSPVLIKYSQELRFYAPLIFFYTISSALGFQAIRKTRFVDWLFFVIVTAIGSFFHLYAAFAFINVIAFSIMYRKHGPIPLRALAVSFLVIFTSVVIAVSQFGSLAGEHSALFTFESPVQVILGGLGFIPPFPTPLTGYSFGLLMLVLTLLGFFRAGKIIAIAVSIILQIGIILMLDAWQGYFASARQLLPLLPLIGLFTARGLSLLLVWLNELFGRVMRYSSRLTVHTVTVIIILTTASLTLLPYYQAEKTSTHEILDAIETSWEPGMTVMVSPEYNLKVYMYYAPWLAGELLPFKTTDMADASFLITDPDFDPGAGFKRLYVPSVSTFYPQYLWIKG